ncbi:MAG: hypothetical protein CL843_09225 [Crocinitomicaceae bacterium]|nr:hypothetical protein [Crocinitomicaceae bacterium]|tara:strand:- start:1901 stop:2419 length:519 start_codon:yes stop_codon:yes gene_type:complete
MITQPLNKLIWIDRSKLHPNDYNPNYVAPEELKLLKKSIIETGWTQPIVVDKHYVIIDGFHRYTVSADQDVFKLTKGKVPVVIIENIDEAHRRIATVRHNRARGTHGVIEMAKILRQLAEELNLSKEEIMFRLGMDSEEVDRLITREGMPALISKNSEGFSKSWTPNRKKPR